MSNQDFVIANVTDYIGGGDILLNPRWGGNVKIGYDPYGLNSNPSKDENVPSSRLAVKGDISASENIIGNGLQVSSFDNVKSGDITLANYIKSVSPTTDLTNYYNKTDSDGKFALQTSLNNYYNKDNINTELQKYSKLNNDATFNNITSSGTISTDQHLQTKGGININDGSKGLKIGNWNIVEDGNKLCFNNSSSGLNIKRCFGDETILTFNSNQPNRTIDLNTNWKLNEESQIISFENNSRVGQGDANLNVNIWLNLSNYTFNKVELKIASNLGRVTVIQTPASNSTENIKTLTSAINYGSEQTLPLSYEISQLNPVSKVICIQVSKSNDYYWFRLLKVTLS